MLKLIDVNSFYGPDEVTVTLLNLKGTTSSGLEKVAADTRISDYVSSLLKPQEGKFYLHINAMGAGEFYGSNKNGDYFPEEQLKQYHKTFEETGYVYRHHINKDPAKSMGRVIYAIYNERMHRVELVAEVDMVLGKDIYDKIQRGEFPQTSMACKTPWDVCSICGNKAHTRQEYCSHLTTQLNKVLPDGRKTMALNIGPLRFFDISIVIKPADITSSVLAKVASEEAAVLSVDMAESEGLFERLEKKAERIKQAALKKLSELVKKIDGGEVVAASKSMDEIMARLHEPGEDLLAILSKAPIEESLNALAELGVSPSIAFLSALIARHHGHHVDLEFGKMVEGFITNVDPSLIPKEALELLGDVEEKDASPHLMSSISKRSDASLTKEAIEKRAGFPFPYNPGYPMVQDSRYHDGYLDTTKPLPLYVTADEHTRQKWREELANVPPSKMSQVIDFFLKVGGAAVIAKMMLSSLVDEKMVKIQKSGLKYRGGTGAGPMMDRATMYAYRNQ